MGAVIKDREQQEEPRKTNSIDSIIAAPGRSYLLVKRIMDLFVATTMGILLLIPMVFLSILICIESKGPAIFRQERLGKDGKKFTIYKFRTMLTTAPTEMPSCCFTDREKYLTHLGKFLRRTSIDELPQLWNVILGDMSIVGYRPICVTENEINDLRKQEGVFVLRPGITGLAQVSGRDNIDYREKVRLDTLYVRNCSFKLDLWCLFKTIKTVFSGEGVK